MKRIIFVLLLMGMTGSNPAMAQKGDPSTIVPPSQMAKWAKEYPTVVTFKMLNSFDYPNLPPPGTKLTPRNFPIPDAVRKLNGQKVAIRGYMMPIDFDATGVSHFVLVDSVDTCCYGIFGFPNSWVDVVMAKKTAFTKYDPFILYGTLRIGEVIMNNNVDSFYRIEGVAIAYQGTSN